jgi:exopolyphosphatase / guanosine-5'-triphosphate,3'-diphosphate pyrophosphatase
MKLAVIDIGSNAIRFQITGVLKYKGEISFKRLEYVRFPLRLGHDTFTIQKISQPNIEKFKKLLHAFKLLIDLYEVEDYMICATSAMREATNGTALAAEIEKQLGLIINIIDGDKEAEFISKSLKHVIDEEVYLHIDVGGGSTELNVYSKKKLLNSQSFKMGSVRRVEHADSPEVWVNMQNWVKENTKKLKNITAIIGTGGNIGKLFELTKRKTSKGITLNQLLTIQKYISGFSFEERVNVLKLNPDRADVIIPAAEIYSSVMEWAGAKNIIVPDAGLKDGMVQLLYEKHKEKVTEIQ